MGALDPHRLSDIELYPPGLLRSQRAIHSAERRKRDIADIDFQHHLAAAPNHNLVWGLGYRLTNDQLTNSETLQFSPSSRVLNLWSGFVQDEITIAPKTLALTVGSKIERNDLTGLVVQPNGRLRWTPLTSRRRCLDQPNYGTPQRRNRRASRSTHVRRKPWVWE